MQRRADKLAQIFDENFEQDFLSPSEHLENRKTTCEVLLAHWHDEMTGLVRFIITPEKLKRAIDGFMLFGLEHIKSYSYFYIVIFENDTPVSSVPITDKDAIRFILALHHDDASLKERMEVVII